MGTTALQCVLLFFNISAQEEYASTDVLYYLKYLFIRFHKHHTGCYNIPSFIRSVTHVTVGLHAKYAQLDFLLNACSFLSGLSTGAKHPPIHPPIFPRPALSYRAPNHNINTDARDCHSPVQIPLWKSPGFSGISIMNVGGEGKSSKQIFSSVFWNVTMRPYKLFCGFTGH